MNNSDIIIPKDIRGRRKKTKRSEIPTNFFIKPSEEIPDKIIIYYSKKINLEYIDKTILYKYEKIRNNIQNLSDNIKKLEQKLENSRINSEKIILEQDIIKNNEYVVKIKKDYYIKKYKNEAEYYIKNFNNDTTKEFFNEYIDIARHYINIDVIKKLEENIICTGCGFDLQDSCENTDGVFICPECNCINNFIKPIKHIKDTEHYLNISNDDDINNFVKVLSKFEGKNVSNIPDNLFGELDEYFIEKGFNSGEYYKNLPLDDEGKKKGTNKKILWQALESLGYNQYYDEINYITHIYWGWKLPNLNLYRDQIIKDYQITQQIWQKIKKDYKRSASLGTQYRLYVQLKAVDYPNCKREDFKIQDMVESLRLHNAAWERMCQEANIKFFPVI